MKRMKVRVTFFEEVLGTSSANPEIHQEFIASKAPDAQSMEEEVAALGADAVFEKGMTVFPRVNGLVGAWDYQWKGFFKDACGVLRKVPKTVASKIKAYKKEIDGLIFIEERFVPFSFDGEPGRCERPLRAQTLQGERVALASSETVPEGTTQEFTIRCLVDEDLALVREMLDYGSLRGFGQWRNSGKGRFTWEELWVKNE